MARESSTRHTGESDLRRLSYLARETTPVYTLPELADRLAAFGTFLDTHCDFITNTGLPPVPFRESLWLYRKLGRLYDTRATWSPWPRLELFPNSVPDAPPYEWFRSDLRSTGVRCQYDEADLLKGLERSDVLRVEADRPRLFSIKRQAISLAECAVRQERGKDLLKDCMRLIAAGLSAEDAEFFLALDRFYLERDVRGGQLYEDNQDLIPGGLSDLLEVTGHMEEELTRRMVRPALDDEVRVWKSADM